MKFPCTGHVEARGFGAFLEAELGEPRRNLRLFADALSERFAATHVTLVNSGSSANLVAAHALRDRAKSLRAAVSAFTFPTTVSALKNAGFEPYFVDARPNDCQIDPTKIPADVGLVALTHFLGWPAPVREIHGVPILQDACETFDMVIDGAPIASLADVTTLSFYHPHHLSSFGGGAALTRDDGLARALESVSHWGRACTHHLGEARGLPCPAPDGPDHNFHYVRDGFNVEMSELNACFGRWSLERHEDDERRRAAHYRSLLDALSPVVVTRAAPDVGVTPFVFPVTVRGDDARNLIDRLLARGVEARSWMGGVIADQPAFRDLPHDGLPNARAIARRSFFVGIHHTLEPEAVEAVGRIVAEEAG